VKVRDPREVFDLLKAEGLVGLLGRMKATGLVGVKRIYGDYGKGRTHWDLRGYGKRCCSFHQRADAFLIMAACKGG
jgi:hypothetical protein